MGPFENAAVPAVMVAVALWLSAVAAASEFGPAQAEQAATAGDLPVAAGSDVARARCLTCHGPELIVQQRLSRDGWSREIDKMIGWGAALPGAERSLVINYLSSHFGTVAISTASGTESVGAALLRARCLVCHGRELIDQQRLTAEGWSREVDKMIAWGAAVTNDEKAVLIQHLSSESRR